MARHLSITEARNLLTRLPEELEKSHETVAITRNGEPKLAVMSWDLYQSMVETMDIMSDPELVAQMRKGIADIEAGRVIPWEEARKELGL